MPTSRLPAILAILAGCALLAVAALYAALPAHALPALLPGHVGAGDPEAARHHIKHAIAALAVGLSGFAYAWFATGPAARRTA